MAQTFETIGADTANSTGTVCTSNISQNNYGAYAVLSASTSNDWDGFFVSVINAGNLGAHCLIDIAIGASTFEVTIGHVMCEFANTFQHNSQVHYFPIAIPSGTRVTARVSHSVGSDTAEVLIVGVTDTQAKIFKAGINFEALGELPNSSTQKGTTIDPGTTVNTKGTWVEFDASTANAVKFLGIQIATTDTTQSGSHGWLIDIGIGAVDSETVIIDNIPLIRGAANDEILPNGFPLLPVDIAASTRIAVRCQSSTNTASDRAIELIINTWGVAAVGGAFVDLDAAVEANATVTADLQVDEQLAFSIEANATVSGNLQVDEQVAASVEANATVEGNPTIIKQFAQDIEANATVTGDFQKDVQLEVAVEGNATVEGDFQKDVQLNVGVEGNATVTGDIQVDEQLASDIEANATVTGDLEVSKAAVELEAAVEANATVEGNIQVDKQRIVSIEANATITGDIQVDEQLAADIEANATVTGDLEVSTGTIDLASDIEANATVSADMQVDEQLAASAQATATVEASLSLIEIAIEEVTKGGGWLPKEELRKLLKIRRSLDRKIKEDREKKDEERREQRRELERIFNRINGIEEVAEELAELVEPFVQAVPETAEVLEAQPQLPSVNFEALATQVETANKLRQLADRLDQISQDEEDVITLLLLV